MRLHDDEFAISDELVHHLVSSQTPQWAGMGLRRICTSGTVNVLYRLGAELVVRLPRAAPFSGGPEHEARWTPGFSHLPLAVPEHVWLGEPVPDYPSRWSVLRWIDGDVARRAALRDLPGVAQSLGEFVNALRAVPIDAALAGGSYRAFGLRRKDDDFHRWVQRLPDDIDKRSLLAAWAESLDAGDHEGSGMWLHSDLRGDNLIARDGELVGVIDWEACSVGDPSADLLAAWWLFDHDSRHTLRSVVGADDDEWLRARGWALHMAVAAIPYYSQSNPIFAAQARSALTEVLADR